MILTAQRTFVFVPLLKIQKLKIAIIQAIDRKVALDDIATANGIEFEELLDEIESNCLL